MCDIRSPSHHAFVNNSIYFAPFAVTPEPPPKLQANDWTIRKADKTIGSNKYKTPAHPA